MTGTHSPRVDFDDSIPSSAARWIWWKMAMYDIRNDASVTLMYAVTTSYLQSMKEGNRERGKTERSERGKEGGKGKRERKERERKEREKRERGRNREKERQREKGMSW